MKNKKRLIVIPALLGLIAGAGVIANNAMNQTKDTEITKELSNDVVVKFAFAGTSSNHDNYYADLGTATTAITLEFKGATEAAIKSTVIGVKSIDLKINEGASTISFDINTCTEDSTNELTSCTIDQKMSNNKPVFNFVDSFGFRKDTNNNNVANTNTSFVELAKATQDAYIAAGNTGKTYFANVANEFMTYNVSTYFDALNIVDQFNESVQITNFKDANDAQVSPKFDFKIGQDGVKAIIA